MRRNQGYNKKAVSEMISYVLLIVIAIGISVGVYSFLKVYVPKAEPKCPDDVQMVLSNYTCSGNTLQLDITNRGLFKITAVYIRLGAEGSKVRRLINSGHETISMRVGSELVAGLNPGATYSSSYPIAGSGSESSRTLEIQPAVYDKETKLLAACTNAIITQPITCT